MALRQRLEHRQKTIFTQSLRQSMRILELPLLELKETIETELIENPALEEIQKMDSPKEDASPAEEKHSEEEDNYSYDKEITPPELSGYEKPIPGKKENLIDVLSKQLRINITDDNDIKIGSLLINNIDDNGYLHADLSGLSAELDCSLDDVLRILKLIQTFDPPGVGARDLKECLLIQLEKNNEKDSLSWKLINEHLEDLANRDFNKLYKKLGCSPEELTEVLKKIHSLEPKPGRGYEDDETVYIVPDVTVEEKDDILNISTKDGSIPHVRVNSVYKNMLKSKKVDEKTKEYIREKIKNATTLIHAIGHRKETLSRVMEIIAETQKEALLEGMDKLKPLALKEIAEKVALHESTISRIVMNKYVQTPAGIFPLREFFSTSLKAENGDEISSKSIKCKIEELIENEDKTQPLRDQAIADLIREKEKITIARRTVVKYREALKIPPVSQRRRNG